jgi:hypothetical protein
VAIAEGTGIRTDPKLVAFERNPSIEGQQRRLASIIATISPAKIKVPGAEFRALVLEPSDVKRLS